MAEVTRLLGSSEVNLSSPQKQKSDRKLRKSPLKAFKKVTLSFIERPRKSTQTNINSESLLNNVKPELSQQCEPNSDMKLRLPADGTAELQQVGSSDAEQTCNKNEKQQTETKIVEPQQKVLQKQAKRVAGDILHLTLSSQLAVCAIKRALESAFEIDDQIEGTSGRLFICYRV